MTMNLHKLLPFSVLSLAFALTPPILANTITYDLTFSGFFNSYGSGTATFDDTPAGPGPLVGETHYNFTSFIGTGAFGTWTTSSFDYNPVNGDNDWRFYTGASFGAASRAIGTGLSPIDALEAEFALMAADGDLTWSRQAVSGVPEGGSTLAMLGLGLIGCVGLQRRLARS